MKSILSKKGDGVEPLMVLALGITVLALLGFAMYLHYSGKIEFFKFLPDFNTTKEKEEAVQILRYDIISDGVQYYDGIKWNDFPSGTFKLGEHNLVYDDVKGDFTVRYWFNKELREMNSVYETVINPGWEFKLISVSSNGLLITKRAVGSVSPKYQYELKNNGALLKLENPGVSGEQFKEVLRVNWDDDEKELESYFLKWRDGILQGEKDAKMASVGGTKVCVKKYDNRYLVVDLADEVNSDEECK